MPRSSPSERSQRLSLLSRAYGNDVQPVDIVPVAVQCLHELAAFTEVRADAGEKHLRSHTRQDRQDAERIATFRR